jgi:Flp pilus assembly protein TadD
VADHPGGPSLLRYGRALWHAGRLGEAVGVFRRVVDLDPDRADAYFHLGIVFEEQGQLAEARKYLEEGLRRQTRQEIFTILGSVQRRSGDMAAAERAYRRSLEMNEGDDEAHLGLGLVLKESDPVQAALHLRECLRLSPAFPGVRRELGHALWRAGDRSQAEATLRDAIAEDPADSWAHDYLGHLLGLKGQWKEAAERFLAVLKLSQSGRSSGATWLRRRRYLGVPKKRSGSSSVHSQSTPTIHTPT